MGEEGGKPAPADDGEPEIDEDPDDGGRRQSWCRRHGCIAPTSFLLSNIEAVAGFGQDEDKPIDLAFSAVFTRPVLTVRPDSGIRFNRVLLRFQVLVPKPSLSRFLESVEESLQPISSLARGGGHGRLAL